MSYIDKVQVGGVEYDVQDTAAQNAIANLDAGDVAYDSTASYTSGTVGGVLDLVNESGANIEALALTEGTTYGLTLAKQTDGSYKVTGTASAAGSKTIYEFTQQAGKTYHYKLNTDSDNSSSASVYFYLFNRNGTAWEQITELVWTAAETKKIYLKLYNKSTASNVNVTIRPTIAAYYTNEELGEQNKEAKNAITMSDFELITEVGNINASQFTWPDSTTRVRMMQDHPIHLNAGAEIWLTDYSAAKMYIIWETDAGAHGSYGWITSSSIVPVYTTEVSGNYWVLLVAVPEATVTNKNNLASLVRIKNNVSLFDYIDGKIPEIQDDNWTVRSINHRGYGRIAPENTIPAFLMSKRVGFKYVETDVRFTSDGVPVLLHDETINRTARNADGTELSDTVNIADITYTQSQDYDFGIWKGTQYAGTKIPTFVEFVVFCKKASLDMYIEIKDETGTRVADLVNIVKRCGMLRHATWIAYSYTALQKVTAADSKARIGLLGAEVTTSVMTALSTIKETENEVFFDCDYNGITEEDAYTVLDAGYELETFTPNSITSISTVAEYVTGVTSDYVVAGKNLLESVM